MTFDFVSTVLFDERVYPLGTNGDVGVIAPCVDDVAVVAVVASVPAVAAVATVAVIAASCALAVVEIMLVIHDGSVLSAGVVLAHETSRSVASAMMIDKSFFILTSEK